MAATDGQITVAAARWADEGHYLREFVAKHRLPAVVKIIKGQYGGLGVPTLPSPGLQSTALLVSAGKRQKIIAQAVKIKEGRRLVCVGPRLVIPETYPGYFELLSEEGRAVRCIESVAELARRRPEEGCLVRETIRAVQAKIVENGSSNSRSSPQQQQQQHQQQQGDSQQNLNLISHVHQDANSVVQPEGARTISAGDILVPNGETVLPGSRQKYLKCLDIRSGITLLLGMEQRGKFSALAREDNISGVHTAKNLLSKRLPITVRLVHGTAPRGLKSPGHFVPELRLLSVFEEEHVFALPLQKDCQSGVTALPLAAPLKVLRTRNEEQLRGMPEFARLVEKCNRLVSDVADRIQVLDGKLGDSKKHHHNPAQPTSQSALDLLSNSSSATNNQKNGYLLRRSASSDSANNRSKYSNNSKSSHHHHSRRGVLLMDAENRIPPPVVVHTKDYDEIDQIYDYVRGFAPLPKNIRSPFAEPSHGSTPSLHPTSDVLTFAKIQPVTTSDVAKTNLNTNSDFSKSLNPTSDVIGDLNKPEPPPIETIPTKKLQAEKRNRKMACSSIRDTSVKIPNGSGQNMSDKIPPGLPKLYVKNGQSQRSRLLRQKSASPMKETPPSPLSSSHATNKNGSPLFNIRYKSLNNLQQAMELDGTLDSSNSGGRASGDSGNLVKQQPKEKRSRKLSRPRSLTNLVWEIREHPDISMPITTTSDKHQKSKMEPPLAAGAVQQVYNVNNKKSSRYTINERHQSQAHAHHHNLSHQRSRGTLYL